MSEILESSENLKGHTMLTVRTSRGDEYVINGDIAVKALADLFSDLDNERRHGWNLTIAWFEHEIQNIRVAVTPTPQD